LYIKHAFIEANKLYNSINVPRRQLRWWCNVYVTLYPCRSWYRLLWSCVLWKFYRTTW
jgi:hypothetical protein